MVTTLNPQTRMVVRSAGRTKNHLSSVVPSLAFSPSLHGTRDNVP